MQKFLKYFYSSILLISFLFISGNVYSADLNLNNVTVDLNCTGVTGQETCQCIQNCINSNTSNSFVNATSSLANNFQLNCAGGDLQKYVTDNPTKAYDYVLYGEEGAANFCDEGIADIAKRQIGIWCNAQPFNCNETNSASLDSPAQIFAVNALSQNQIIIENISATPAPIVVPTSVATPTPIPGEYTPSAPFMELEGEMQSYGDTCGLAGVAGKNMCCVSKIPRVKFNAPSGLTEAVINFGQTAVNFMVDKVNLFSQTTTLGMYNLSESVGSEFTSDPFCYTGKPSSFKEGGNQDPFNNACTCEESTTGAGGTPNEAICSAIDPIKNSTENAECIRCFTGGGGVWTALGCIETDFSTFITKTIFGTGIGLAGIVALLCIIYSSFLMQTSQGNPEQITKAQEMLTSCITGLIMIIFSVLILRFIGVDLLRIPGFSNTTEIADDGSSGTTTTVSLSTTTPTVVPVTPVVPKTTIKPTVIARGTPTVTPVPRATTVPTVTPVVASTITIAPSPTLTPFPTPTLARPGLGEFDCDKSTSTPLANEVYLFDQENYAGACVRLTLGSYGLQAVTNKETQGFVNNWGWTCRSSFNDCIASFRVGADVRLNMYQHPIATDIPDSGGCLVSVTNTSNNLSGVGSVNCGATNITDNVSYVVVESE